MTDQAEARPAGADVAKAILAGALVLAGVVAVYAFPARAAPLRWLMFIGGLGLGVAVIALAAICENHRDRVLARIRTLSAALATWE